MNMDQIKKQRSSQRTQTTKLLKLIEEYSKHPTDSKLKLEALKSQLEVKQEELKKLDREILNLATDIEEELTVEIESADSYQFSLLEGFQRINMILQESKKVEETVNNQNELCPSKTPVATVKLPTLELPKFDGDISQWLSFWEFFDLTIHQKKELTNVEKFKYLRSLLQGEAASVIQGFELVAENYEDAINVLKENFGSKDTILEKHIKSIFELKPIKDVNNLKQLKNLINELFTHMRSLKNLGVDPNRCREMMKIRIKELFPMEWLLTYERQREGDENIDQLMKHIQKEVKIAEALTIQVPLNPTAPSFQPRYNNNRPSTSVRPSTFSPQYGPSRARNPQQWRPRFQKSILPRVPNSSVSSMSRPSIRCFGCGQVGHYKKDCGKI